MFSALQSKLDLCIQEVISVVSQISLFAPNNAVGTKEVLHTFCLFFFHMFRIVVIIFLNCFPGSPCVLAIFFVSPLVSYGVMAVLFPLVQFTFLFC